MLFRSGDYIVLTPANPATSHINSTNGGVNICERSDRGVHDLALRVQRYSESDGFLNNLLRQSPPVVINGSLKENFTRDGTDGVESWSLELGSVRLSRQAQSQALTATLYRNTRFDSATHPAIFKVTI